MALEKAGEAGELAVPILLPALDDHGARGVAHPRIWTAERDAALWADLQA
jgi:hypothetical protein